MKTTLKKLYIQPRVLVSRMEPGNLLDGSIDPDSGDVTLTPGGGDGTISGDEVNSKLTITDVWE